MSHTKTHHIHKYDATSLQDFPDKSTVKTFTKSITIRGLPYAVRKGTFPNGPREIFPHFPIVLSLSHLRLEAQERKRCTYSKTRALEFSTRAIVEENDTKCTLLKFSCALSIDRNTMSCLVYSNIE